MKGCGVCGADCTKHKYDEELKKWKRCPNADVSIFYSGVGNLPARYKQSNWNDFTQTTNNRKVAFQYAQAVVDRIINNDYPKKALVFTGKDFSGKTMISSLILRALIIKDISCKMVSLAVLTDLYFTDRQAFAEYNEPHVLCLQMGSEIANASSTSIVKEIFKERTQKLHYTFFTSKIHVVEFAKVYSKELQDFFMTDIFKELKLP